jgi:hypothetical protein
MPRVLAKIGDREVVYASFLIIPDGDEATIYPFDDDEEFLLIVKVVVDDEAKPGTRRTYDDDITRLTHTRHWADGGATGNLSRNSFASDEDFSYYIAFSTIPIGRQDKFAIQFNYVVSREKKQ